MKRLVIFDLDGTLLNTIGDLAEATNYALMQCGYPQHPVADYNMFVGNGIAKLFERPCPRPHGRTKILPVCALSLFPITTATIPARTKPYDGITALITALQQRGVELAVASNKYQRATEKLVAHFFPEIRFTAVLGQREGYTRETLIPPIVYDILSAPLSRPTEALYVGDRVST